MRRTSPSISMRSMSADNADAIRSLPAGTSMMPKSSAASTSESITIWPGRTAITRSIISALPTAAVLAKATTTQTTTRTCAAKARSREDFLSKRFLCDLASWRQEVIARSECLSE